MSERISAAAFKAGQAAKAGRPQRVKGARPVTVDGIRFHSSKEARRWQELRLMEKAGEISDLKRQVPVPLNGRSGPILTPTGRPATYVADFTYRDASLGGALVIEDAKGHPTELYLLKRAILAADDIHINEV